MAAQADLASLVELVGNEGLALPPQLADVDRLTPYGARVRYGGDDPGTVDPSVAVTWAEGAVAWAAGARGDRPV